MHELTLLNWGSYDVDNFGDLLFPFLVEHHARHSFSNVVAVSPTGIRSRWPDARPTRRLAEVLSGPGRFVLVVGGGNLISVTRSSSVNYRETPAIAELVHPAFFYLPYLLRRIFGIPYAFNFVGVAKPIPVDWISRVRVAAEGAAYIGVRGEKCAARLREAGVRSRIDVDFDTAINTPRVFPTKHLVEHFECVCRPRYELPPQGSIAVLHIKARYLNQEYEEVRRVAKWCGIRGYHPVFVPLSICHGDALLFDSPDFVPDGATVIREPQELRDLLAILAAGKVYIGSSLHGAITSLAYGNKAILVADEPATGFSKFSDFLDQISQPTALHRAWRTVPTRLEEIGEAAFASLSRQRLSEICDGEEASRHWSKLARSLLLADTRRQTSADRTDQLDRRMLETFCLDDPR